MIGEKEAPSAEPAIQDIYPLSPMQQGMLFHTLFAPDSAVYIEQFACILEGDLDATAFERAWQRAAERHAILRTAFLWEGVREPHQVVFDRVELLVERLDWRGLAAAEQRRALDHYLAADRARGFDLLSPPLMRLTLVRIAERVWRFIWRFHHLLLDGWSGNLLLGEVFHLYESFRRGREPHLASAPLFHDYIAWLGRQDLARAEAFWRRALAGFTAPTPLVVDRPGAEPCAEDAYGRRHTAFAASETDELARLARSGQVTLATLFEGAWALLLARYSREPEVVFGATSSGRPVDLPGVEGMVGLFVNTLPARVEVPLSARLLPWLRTLQEQQAEMREYEYSPLAQVQSWSDVPAGTPLFESIQGLENYPVSRWGGQRIEGLALRDLEAFERTNYPLTVLASPGNPMSLEVWFERRRFDPATIDRMLGHLQTLLAGFLAGDRLLGDLPLLTAPERVQALAAETGPPAIAEGVQELFEVQVEKTPEAVALLGEGEALTYRQVNGAANRIAWRLRSLGVEPEDLVGVSAASPLRMVVAILGVLKAGAAYVPLDPGYPQERLAFILATAGVRVLLADPGLLPLPAEGIVRIDAVPPADGSEENPPVAARGIHLAYAIFTSGSTGRPKGIVVSQEALLHLARSFIAALGLGPGDRLLMVPSLSFDASVGDLFPALLSGATLVVHPAPSELAAESLTDLCAEHGVTVVDIPAAFWNAWAEALAAAPRRDLLPSLRLVIAGGESIAPERVERWAAATGRRATFFGPYGPTEATVCTTAYTTVDARELPPGAVRLPIGRPLPHARVRLLDPGFQPVPVLVPGEIAIGGAGLARGYLGRPDLTAESFVPDPFASAPGERLYRTGDLARLLPDGNLEFAGRVDQQVKVRGYRIETGEIESVLLRHPAVREAVVAAREDNPGEKRLVAYVVPEPAALPREEGGFDPWQTLFEESYASGVAQREATLAAALVNFTGWNSSATGLPIPEAEMREWADLTAERILALRPRRVLEIGCGTGLLLLRIAPYCAAYVGTDFSAAALGYLDRVLAQADPPMRGVELRRQRADDWSGVAPESFDVVVLNSVVQYFPGIDYLRQVVHGAVVAVRPGGAVFLGDLRSLPLLAAFHEWVETSQAPEGLPDAELARRVARRIALERELAVDPELFAALARELPRIGRVEVQLKSGRSRNELTRFRYDVTLHVGPPAAAPPGAEAPPRPWSAYGNEPARGDAARRLVPALRELLQQSLPDYMVPAAFVVLDALPVTPNGKVDRRALPPPDFERREREPVAPRTPAEQALAAIWAEVLGLAQVGVDDNFFELGGDSILSIQIVSRAGQAGIPLTPKQIFEHQTIASLAAAAGSGPAVAAEQGTVAGEAPLTPIQRWFFARPQPEPHHWNQALLFELHEPFAPAVLAGAVDRLLAHHDALRLRFLREGESVRQVHAAPGGAPPFAGIDLAALPEERRSAELTAAAAALQGSLDLERGPLLRVALFDLGPGLPPRLLAVVHHLVIDGVSWRILLEDLAAACRDVALPAKTTSFRQWAERLAGRAAGDELAAELPYWLAEPRAHALRLPLDILAPGRVSREGSAETVTVQLPAEETHALLREASAQGRINDVLLAALARALGRWTGPGPLVVDLEGHGRAAAEDVDLSRTVGWLTVAYPVLLEVPEGGPEASLRAVEEQLRRVPGDGSGYGLLRWLGSPETAARLAALPPAEVNFNYLGQLDQVLPESSPLRPAAEPIGANRSPQTKRRHLLEINAFVAGGRLRVDWSYSALLHRRETIERLAAGFTAALAELIAAGSEIEDVYPLSPMQEGMLFHTLYSPDSGVYVQQLACTLRGGLDPRALRKAWERVFQRHPALRTAFLVRAEGRPLQMVRRRVDMPWEELDWRALPAPERRRRLLDLARTDRERGFDPSAAPLSRLWLVRGAEDEHCLLWSHHHLLMDGWCLPLVLRDVLAGYETLRQGREPSFPPVRPYRDYIAWIERQDHKAAERFFQEMLAGLDAPTPLGIDRPPAAPGASPGLAEAHRGHLTAEESERLRAFARRHRLTLNTLVQGAWALLLARYGGTEDVVFGVTVSGRPAELPDIEEMVGLFVNTLPVRVRVDLERLPAPWLQELQATNLELRRFEATPLVNVQSWSGLPGGTPLFESLLAFESYPVDPSLAASGGSLSLGDIETFERTNYPLQLLVVPGQLLAFAINCDSDRVDGAAAARAVKHLLALLADFAAGQKRRLGDHSPFSPAERHQVLLEWNDSKAPPLRSPSLARLFEERAAAAPGAVAVVCGKERLAYGELNVWANRMAHRLRDLGVEPGVRVGISVARSPALVAAILAVLKAGGVYVPIDPAYPTERRAFLLADSRAPVLVVQGGGSGIGIPEGTPAVLDLDEVPRQGEDPGDLPALTGSESLLYVIYTSGSTGQPKGAGIYQGAFLRLVSWYIDALPPDAEERTLVLSSASHDITQKSYFAPLLRGGELHLAEPGYDPAALVATIERERITRITGTPSAFYPLIDEEGSFPRLASLRGIFPGGEPLSLARLRLWLSSDWCRSDVFNTYGPTECTDVASFHRLEEGGGAPIGPIGRPLPGFHLYVLGPDLAPLPAGVAGELWIGGGAVGAGYLGDPALTATKFVPDPLGGEPGARLYRTGDSVRALPSGVLEFVRRLDQQVKIRGFRIEPGEVEAALVLHPGVREAAVVPREAAPGDVRLVAYCVPRGEGWDADASDTELRRWLAERLPEPLIPSTFVRLDAMPMTPTGKLDRRALQAPPADREPAARSALSLFASLIAEIWADVLGVADIGAEDSFFDLGGHSLLATQVVSRLRSTFGIDVPLRALFEAPTLAGLATRIETEMRAGGPEALPPIEAAARSGPLPLSYTQLRLWFLHRLAPDSPAYNMPMAIRFAGGLDIAAMEGSLEEMVRRHESLRTVFHPAPAGEPVQIVLPVPPFRLPVVDLGGLAAEVRRAESGRLSVKEAIRPFDLERGPLLRAIVLRLDAAEHVLLGNLHHIVCDGWSLRIFEAEATALYDACRAGSPSPLPELSLQYPDFAVWQRQWLQGEALESQLAYWKRQFRDLPQPLSLPSARPRPAVTGVRGALQTLRLDETVTASLRELARAEGGTPFIVLMAGLQALLCRYSGQSDFCVGTPIAGRNRMETEGLIGCFLNTLALRADLAGDPTFRELLARVREVSLGAFTHQDLPFEKLLEELQPERDLQRTPIFQVQFNLLNLGGGAGGDEDRPEAGGMATAVKLDLSVHAIDREGGIEIDLQYDADLFDALQMASMAEHLRELLTGAVSQPDRRISALPLRSPALQQVWTEAPAWVESSIAERFRRVAREHAGDLAVATADHRWSYETLDRISDRAALVLARQDAPRVALLFSQGAPRIAAVLSTLKAGRTYLPLDPGDPEARLAAVLRDAEVGAILTEDASLDLASRLTRETILTLDLAVEGETVALPAVPPETPAYILYTSGSTGLPKGVVQSHRNVLHHIRTYADALRIAPSDRLSLLPSYTFDAAVMDIFGALLTGASLFPFDVRREGTAALARWMRTERITIYHSTPTLYRRVLDELEDEVFPDARLVVLGGERCLRRDLERFRAHFPLESLFVNGLGPTESTLALQCFAPAGSVVDREAVPVGRPVAGTRVLLRNAAGEQAAVYGIGEIEIQSPYLALGYWRQPGLTAAAFADDPENGRVYRTGDLGRWLPDGMIEFVGRSDAQVKIRGHRVELGEIEAALNTLPGVREAVVTARADRWTGEPRLAAYLLCPAGEAADPRWLRQALRKRLPDPMIPADFVPIETWPLTSTGKIDRQALPEPPEVRPVPEAAGGEPRSPLEELLCDLWAEVLGLERAGVNDDFFALGGHSLLATQLLSRIRQVGSVEMPLRAVFEAPTAAAMAERMEQALLSGVAGELGPRPPIVPASRDGAHPLSFGQQRFWFLEQLQPGTAAYNLPTGIVLSGVLEIPALAAAFSEIARRHEVLRTTFHDGDGAPVQVIAPAGPVPLPVRDLSSLPPGPRRAEASRLAVEEARRPFDLERGPMLRAGLLRLEDREHALLASFHHAVTDGWSQGIFWRELSVLYGAFVHRLPSPLAELPVQYADFASWQRGWLAGEALDAQLTYWRERLLGAAPRLELPLDRPRPAFSAQRGAIRPLDLAASLSDRVRDLGRRTGTTSFMILLAALQAVLARYTGEENLSVGTPIAGRTRVELEGLIGLFVNTLVMRGDLAGNPSFGELLRRTRDAALQAHAHQDLPFERLVEELQPERSLDVSPLFQVMLAFQNVRRDPRPRLPDLELGLFPIETGTVKFDLSLTVSEVEGRFAGIAEYAADLFDATTIDRLLGHLSTLLDGAAASPELRLSELPLLKPEERHQLLGEWGDTAASDPREEIALHQLVLAQAARTPDAVAVIGGDERLTYRELAARSARLAARLAGQGIGVGSFVPVLLEGGSDLVVTFLGILRAGAAFVPLDPSWPAARLEGVLEEVRSDVVVDREMLEQETGAPTPEPVVPPEAPMYAIYTSGSMGRPKGVVVPHRGIVNRFLWMDQVFGLAAARSVLQTTRPIYDSVVWQLFWPLIHGGATVLTDPGRSAEPAYIRGLIGRHGITLTDFVPSVFNLLVEQLTEAGETAPLESLRAVIVGGEEMAPAAARLFLKLFPGVLLVNLYGPTEASIGCIYHEVEEGDGSSGRVPIGRPISNVLPVILDRWGSPAPVGVPGELHLSGQCLGTGYLREGGQTGGAFIPNPLPEIPCDRAYRTGDLARRLPDGEIDFLGRIDRQVKIRGLRIELGEIEAALRRHPGVSAAAVLLWEGMLAACVVGASGDELREFLRERLPSSMLPSFFVALDALPHTPGGKVDRRALAGIVAAHRRSGTGETATAPRTPFEEILAGVWADVLRVERVGSDDEFFSLGGHSLLATQVISRIRQAFGVELPIRALFEAPTLAGLARRIEGAGLAAAPPIRPVPHDRALPLSFAQQRLWFLDRLTPGAALYHLFSPLLIQGALNPEVLAHSLGEIVRRHESLRTSFPAVDGEPVQAIAATSPFHLPLIDLRGLTAGDREDEIQRQAAIEAGRCFDLARGPLLRALLLRLSPDRHAVLFSVHHMVCDGWSLRLFLRELSALHAAFSRGESSPLPEPRLQYADFAVWQREWLRGEALEIQIDYWRRQVAGAPPVLDLPSDRPRPAVQSFRGERLPVALPAPLSSDLGLLARRERSTLFMVLLAGLGALLFRYTGQERLLVGTPIANRNRAEIEDLIGNFANTLVLGVSFQRDLPFLAALSRVRESALGAYSHQDLPFEVLVETLNPRRDLSFNPLFQVLFGFHNLPAAPETAGLALRPLAVGSAAVARLDLALDLNETPEAVQGTLEYATDLFDTSTVQRLAGHLLVLLGSAAARPNARLSELPLLTGEERRQLLDWSGTVQDQPSGRCLHELFEAWAERTPDAPALVGAGERLTYRELDCRANRVASALRRLGAGPEVPVGLYLERSPDLIAALLGVLKAGAAYLPLDLAYPAPRLARILDTAGAPLVVTRGSLAGGLPQHQARIVDLDAPFGVEEAAPAPAVLPDNLAYVIFTSGSTGVPKGAQVTHRSAVHLMETSAPLFDFEPGDVWTVVHSFAFDFSVWEIWGALAHGGTLVVVPPEVARSPDSLAELVVSERVTILSQTPSALRQLLESGGLAAEWALRQPRLIVCGGEALPAELVPRLLERKARVWNFYGPTESTVWAAAGPVRPIADLVPLGAPLPDNQLLVLDATGQPLPVNVAGELCIAGAGLARGYFRAPDLTAERFTPHPFADRSGERLYRTGDLVRRHRDGSLEFLGRIDQQVKIRGFRIELGEIESVLAEHPGVTQAVVTATAIAPAETGLVAHVVGKTSSDDLRRFTAASLPAYMVPSLFVPLDRLPLTSNGKVDRRALSEMRLGNPISEGAKVPPRDTLELQLVRLWEDLLPGRRVGVTDDFFDLGGHSMLAVRLLARVRSELGQDLPVSVLFQHSTVERLAAVLRRSAGRMERPVLVEIQPGAGKRPLFLVHPVGGNVLCYLDLARSLGPDQPVYGLQAPGRTAGIEELAIRYLEAVRSVQPQGPYALGAWSMGGMIAFEMARRLEEAGERVAPLVLIDAEAPRPGGPLAADPVAWFAHDLARSSGLQVALPAAPPDQDPEERLAWIHEQALAAGLLPPELGLEEIGTLFSLFRSNAEAMTGYSGAAYDGEVVLFRAAASGEDDGDDGWRQLAGGRLQVRDLPGDHYSILRRPAVEVLARELSSLLSLPPREPLDD